MLLQLLFFILATLSLSAPIPPNWVQNFNINAGQSKPVDFLGMPTSTLKGGKTLTFTQTYNASFSASVSPKIILGQIGFGIQPNLTYNSVLCGYTVSMWTVTNINFKYNVTTANFSIVALHYIYLAISNMYDSMIFISTYPFSFIASDQLNNATFSSSTRQKNIQLQYPRAAITNGVGAGEIIMDVWPLYFVFTPVSGIISFNLSVSALNTTHFTLLVKTNDNFLLQKLGVNVILVNRTALFIQSKYLIYVDKSYSTIIGNTTSVITANSDTITDFNTQYFYRNTISGFSQVYITMTPLGTTNLTLWYGTATSSSSSILIGRSVGFRNRLCPNSSYFYFWEQQCYSSCPLYYFTNTTGFYCDTCHFSCYNCTAANLSNTCNACQNSSNRQLNNSYCLCKDRFYENNTKICPNCHFSCKTCDNNNNISCLTCSPSDFRILDNKTCLCSVRYYDALTSICKACHFSCKTCDDQFNNSCLSCQPTDFRQLNNKTCICMVQYFDQLTQICTPCHYSCYSCDGILNTSCLSCSNPNFRTLNNKSCPCNTKYYDNNALLCLPCSLGCLKCSDNTTCLQCDNSSNFISQFTACKCNTGYNLSGSACILTVSSCGDGILTSAQQCDDNNIINGDGCSSSCLVEPSHKCINNGSIYAYSLCYYSDPIIMSVQIVFKPPLINQVQTTILISAPNCNPNTLKEYLQSQTSLTMASNRLLKTTPIKIKSSSYSIQTSKLKLNLQYFQSIDLSLQKIGFGPSSSVSSRYFYASPVAQIGLKTPDNKLLTTFLSENDIQFSKKMSWAYLALIILNWTFFIISIFYGQTAVTVQGLLVIQICFESLLRSGYIFEGWVGLVFYGKYTYGGNIGNIVSWDTNSLSTLGLSELLINNINITVGLIALTTCILLVILISQSIQYYKQDDEAITAMQIQQNNNTFLIKKGIAIGCLQILLSFNFLTIKIFIISLIEGNGGGITANSIPTIILVICYIISWLIYLRYLDSQFMKDLSYRRLLRLNITQQQSILQYYFIKYHFFIMFICMFVFGLIISLVKSGVVVYLCAILGSFIWLMTNIFARTYLRNIHNVRSSLNVFCACLCMILLLIQSVNVIDPTQNNIPPLIGLLTLYSVFGINLTVFVRLQLRKAKKKPMLKTINVIEDIKVVEKQNTQDYVKDINQSNYRIQKGEFEQQPSKIQNESFMQTKKKFGQLNNNYQDNEITAQKKKIQFQQIDPVQTQQRMDKIERQHIKNHKTMFEFHTNQNQKQVRNRFEQI